jgi:DNA-binding response OmpR family regulator
MPATPAVWRLLYVDSDQEARLLMQELLSAHPIDAVATAEEARALSREHAYDIYIIGAGGPDSEGVELCAWLRRVDPRTPIVFCSSNGSARYEQAAIAAGALRFHLKPVQPQQLLGTLNLLLKLTELETLRAWSIERAAILDELSEQSRALRERAEVARCHAEDARRRMVRVKAYRAFREAGGNRANFERLWPQLANEV